MSQKLYEGFFSYINGMDMKHQSLTYCCQTQSQNLKTISKQIVINKEQTCNYLSYLIDDFLYTMSHTK